MAILSTMAQLWATFANFKGNATTTEQGKTSHLQIGGNGAVRFKDSNSKIILDFGDSFELGKEYSISKLVTDSRILKMRIVALKNA